MERPWYLALSPVLAKTMTGADGMTAPHTPPGTDAVLRMALVCWSVDPHHGITPAQHAWLTARLTDQTPLLPAERVRPREPLQPWCRRRGGEKLAALIQRQYGGADDLGRSG